MFFPPRVGIPCFIPSPTPFPLSLPLFACPPLTPPSLVKQVDSTSITAKSVRGLRGPPGQGPRGVWGCRRVTPGSKLLPRLELMAQFRDALLFLEEENNRVSGREEIRKGWRREGESEKNVGEREGETGRRKEQEPSGRNRESRKHTVNTVGQQSGSGKQRRWGRGERTDSGNTLNRLMPTQFEYPQPDTALAPNSRWGHCKHPVDLPRPLSLEDILNPHNQPRPAQGQALTSRRRSQQCSSGSRAPPPAETSTLPGFYLRLIPPSPLPGPPPLSPWQPVS